LIDEAELRLEALTRAIDRAVLKAERHWPNRSGTLASRRAVHPREGHSASESSNCEGFDFYVLARDNRSARLSRANGGVGLGRSPRFFGEMASLALPASEWRVRAPSRATSKVVAQRASSAARDELPQEPRRVCFRDGQSPARAPFDPRGEPLPRASGPSARHVQRRRHLWWALSFSTPYGSSSSRSWFWLTAALIFRGGG
jgi:hypothetical protein